jgi:hypothetical protein
MIEALFSSPTGIEAYKDGYAEAYIRATYGVGVVIQHSSSSPNGYLVVTAFPANP